MHDIVKQIIADTIALLLAIVIGMGLLWLILFIFKQIAGLF